MPLSEKAASCPWCDWKLDLERTPYSQELARSKLEYHKRYCHKKRGS